MCIFIRTRCSAIIVAIGPYPIDISYIINVKRQDLNYLNANVNVCNNNDDVDVNLTQWNGIISLCRRCEGDRRFSFPNRIVLYGVQMLSIKFRRNLF